MSLSQSVKDLILGLMGGEPGYQKEVVDGLEGGQSAVQADGSVPFTGNQSMGSHRLTSVTDPSGAQDAATKNYVDTHGVSSFNTLSGAVTISAGSNITLTPVGNDIAIAASGSSGANTALSNLASTAINANLNPASDHVTDLGTNLLNWRTLNVKNIDYAGTLMIGLGDAAGPQLYSGGSVISVDAAGRQLLNSAASVVLDWSTPGTMFVSPATTLRLGQNTTSVEVQGTLSNSSGNDFDMGDGNITAVGTINYTPADSGSWNGNPTTLQEAIDRLAAAVAGLLGNPVP